MASIVPRWTATFADHLTDGQLIATSRQGSNPMRITGPPLRVKNLVGERTYVRVPVCLVDTGAEGQMIYRASEVVFTENQR